jgi:DNA-binding GntR family transcriptional regulator
VLAVPTCTTKIDNLSLMVQRLLDAELLPDTEGAALLAETRAACRALEAGDTAAARRHIEQVVRLVETLVASDALNRADGGAVMETAGQILAGDTG